MAIIAVLTAVTVFIWIFIQTYNTATKESLPPKTQELAAPIDPTIRQDVLQKLNNAQP